MPVAACDNLLGSLSLTLPPAGEPLAFSPHRCMTRGFEEDRCSPLDAGALLYPPPRCRRPTQAVQIRSAVDLDLVTDEPGLAGHSSGRRRTASLPHLWSPSDGAADRFRMNCFNCSATAPVSYPTFIEELPQWPSGPSLVTPAAESHRLPKSDQTVSYSLQFLFNYRHRLTKMHKAVEAWKQKKIHK
jgi:hypothetical protein